MKNIKRIIKDNNVTRINIRDESCKDDPFILATQAQQVFYRDDYKLGDQWKVVKKITHCHLWDVPEVEQDGDNQSK